MEKQTKNKTKKQTKTQLFWEFVRFLLVGSVATVIDYFLFWLFDGAIFRAWDHTLALILATALGFCAGLIVNWLLSVRFVFRQVKDKEKACSKKSFILFALIGLGGLLLTEFGVVALVALLPEFSLFGSVDLLGTPWDKWVAKVIMTWVVIVWNYVGRKCFIFKS